MRVSTIRPGLLVSLSVRTQGNVQYARVDIETEHLEDDGTRRARWETAKVVENPEEHDRAVKVRGKARSLVSSVCSPSNHGLLCPESNRDKLEDAVEEAKRLIDDFNRSAALTQVQVYIIIGRVAADDVEAIRAINSEIRDLMSAMERGLQSLNVEAVREAANKARELSAMLTPEASERAMKAIQVARSAARRIVKAGEAAAVEIDEATLRTIRESRITFLDLDEAAEIQTPQGTARAIDLEPESLDLETSTVQQDLFDDTPPVIPASIAKPATELEF